MMHYSRVPLIGMINQKIENYVLCISMLFVQTIMVNNYLQLDIVIGVG